MELNVEDVNQIGVSEGCSGNSGLYQRCYTRTR